MEELVKIKKALIDKIKKNKRLLNCGSKWVEAVDVSVAEEFIRQAVDDACFLFTKKHPNSYDPSEELRAKLRNLKKGQQITVNIYEYQKESQFVGYAHGICRHQGFKITTKEIPQGWLIKRL